MDQIASSKAAGHASGRPQGSSSAHTSYDWRDRQAGVLLHPTSLPGRHGIGDLGAVAGQFLQFLAAAGARLWQVLPLGPAGTGNSPYACRSAFAGNPLLIALDDVAQMGLLTPEDLDTVPVTESGPVTYDAVKSAKGRALRLAYNHFREDARGFGEELTEFCRSQRYWLDDWALFEALSECNPGKPWPAWDSRLAGRDPAALDRARQELADAVPFHRFVQWLFFRQWHALRRRANELGIQVVGDIPIFIAHDSADVWARQDLFYLDDAGNPTVVAGVPPDYFSATGQRWGNPLYRWDVIRGEGYAWWIERLRSSFELVDLLRIDHFRGFDSYWEIPADEMTAVNGCWRPGPGRHIFDVMEQALGGLPIIVEDLGENTESTIALRDALGYPGMKVMHFAFDGDSSNPFLPFNYERNFVAYTGTHDNNTTAGWYAEQDEQTRDRIRRYLRTDGGDIAWDLIRCVLSSVAQRAVIPLQDLLSLGKEARMNVPGHASGNWTWRVERHQLSSSVAGRFREMVHVYGRDGRP